MRFIPNTRRIRKEMLESIGLGPEEDLFAAIPRQFRLEEPLDLPLPMDEPSLAHYLMSLGGENEEAGRRTCLLGGGAYYHYIPSVVRHVVSRSEFYTAYTPYQPEISQGTLQAIFEYQTMIAALTGMDVSNASLYDGASSAAEAILMAVRLHGGKKVVLSRTLNPLYRQVVETYLRHGGLKIMDAGYDESGRTDYGDLSRLIDDDTACFVVQSPNFFGVIEDAHCLKEIRKETNALMISVVAEPISLGLLSPPGEWGADIVAMEGQSFGNPLGYGGPYLGIMASREAYVRQMPGRLVGETVDARGQRGFVLTLSTREQHIRRERATSNICSNQGLCALTAAVYLSILGPEGLRRIAALNVARARTAYEGLKSRGGWSFPVGGPVFNEFVAVPAAGAEKAQKSLRDAGFTGGLEMGRWYPDMPEALLFCFTEMVEDEDIDRFLQAAGGAS